MRNSGKLSRKEKLTLAAILFASFVARVVIRHFAFRGEDFWTSGYSLFADIGNTLAHTGHFSFDDSAMLWHAIRPPLYPLVIAGVRKYFDGSVTLFLFLQAAWST